MTATFADVVRAALPRMTWRRSALPASAVGLVGDGGGVRVVTARWKTPQGFGYVGGASCGIAVVHLTPDLAREAFEVGYMTLRKDG